MRFFALSRHQHNQWTERNNKEEIKDHLYQKEKVTKILIYNLTRSSNKRCVLKGTVRETFMLNFISLNRKVFTAWEILDQQSEVELIEWGNGSLYFWNHLASEEEYWCRNRLIILKKVLNVKILFGCSEENEWVVQQENLRFYINFNCWEMIVLTSTFCLWHLNFLPPGSYDFVKQSQSRDLGRSSWQDQMKMSRLKK